MMIPDVRKDIALPIIRQKVVPDLDCLYRLYPVAGRPRLLRVPPPQDRPLRRLCSRSPHLHQRNRELLEIRAGAHRSVDTSAFRKPTFRSSSRRPEFRFNYYEKPQPAIANPQTLGQTLALANRSGTAPSLIANSGIARAILRAATEPLLPRDLMHAQERDSSPRGRQFLRYRTDGEARLHDPPDRRKYSSCRIAKTAPSYVNDVFYKVARGRDNCFCALRRNAGRIWCSARCLPKKIFVSACLLSSTGSRFVGRPRIPKF